jgi:hypothetical protein
MVSLYPGIRQAGYEGNDDPSPKSMRRAAALAANPLPYVARAVTMSGDGDITVTREDGSSDIVWCFAGWNAIRFTRLEADAGALVKDVHF